MPDRSTGAATGRQRGGGSSRKKPPARREIGSVVESSRAFLEKLPEDLGTGPEASALIAAAQAIDKSTSDHARSMCLKEFRELMARLRELAPAEEEADGIDELQKRREARRAAS